MYLGCHSVVGFPAKFSKQSTSCKSSAHAVPCQEQCSLYVHFGSEVVQARWPYLGESIAKKGQTRCKQVLGRTKLRLQKLNFSYISESSQIARFCICLALGHHDITLVFDGFCLWFDLVWILEAGSKNTGNLTGQLKTCSLNALPSWCVEKNPKNRLVRRGHPVASIHLPVSLHPMVCALTHVHWKIS